MYVTVLLFRKHPFWCSPCRCDFSKPSFPWKHDLQISYGKHVR